MIPERLYQSSDKLITTMLSSGEVKAHFIIGFA
jgi:hypothetical protein